MTPEAYRRFRDELARLLDQSAQITGVEEAGRRQMGRIRRRVLEDQFRIVLAGEFQSGKSTTFNALCDGRNLSPTGFGIKTSGCLLTARHLSSPDQAEHAEIHWRTAADLVAGFADLLLPHFQETAPNRFGRMGAAELADGLDLAQPADRRLLISAVQAEWRYWRKNRSGYDAEGSGNLDVLRAASLISAFHDAPELVALKQQSRFAVSRAAAMAAFPQDWEARWAAGDPNRFRLPEIAFLFIREIRLHIHSPGLGRLGCVLMDCPGLLASRWDTETARAAMFDADVILYLFDGSKTLKMSDLKALRFIRGNGMAHKLLFGCNLRGHSLADGRRILAVSRTALENNGFSVPETSLVLFHALLSCAAARGERLLESPAPPADPLQKVQQILRRQLVVVDPSGTAAFSPDDAVLIAQGRHLGGLKALRDMVENRVVGHKAHAVLVDNGARAAAECLAEAEGALRLREELSLQKEAAFRRNVAEVETGIRKFRGDCAGIIDRIGTEEPDAALAEEIWQRLTSRKQDLVDRCADRIHQDILSRFSPSLLARKTFNGKVVAVIREEIDALFTETIHAWVAEIKAGTHPVYNRKIAGRVRRISRDLNRIWQQSGLSDTDFLGGIAVPELTGDLAPDTARIFHDLEEESAFDSVRYNAILAAGGITGVFTAFSGLLVGVYLLITRLFWVRIATVAALVANLLLMVLTRGMIEKSLRKEMEKKLGPALDLFFTDIREEIQSAFKSFSREIRLFYQDYFRQAVDKPRRIFEARREQAEAEFTKSRQERLENAARARQIRKTQLEPLRNALEAFIRRVGLPQPDDSPNPPSAEQQSGVRRDPS